MIQDGDLDRSVYTYDTLSLLVECDAEDCMNAQYMFHMREYYVLKYQRYDPDTPMYMEALSSGHGYEYYKVMDDEIQSLVKRNTWDIVSIKSVADYNVLPRTSSFKCMEKYDWTIRKNQGIILYERRCLEETVY